MLDAALDETRHESSKNLGDKPLKYKRILLKVSGEALMGSQGFGLDPETMQRVAREIKQVHDLGVQIALVIGGGNIFRGIKGAAGGMERTTADHMGMLATVINCLGMRDALEKIGLKCRVHTGIEMNSVAEPFIRGRAINQLSKGYIVLFGAGTGNPYFSTDTGAALRAAEIGCEAIFKATKVDGVYDSDPMINPDAKRFDHISYHEVLTRELGVMDQTAIALTRQSNIPIIVFSLLEEGAMAQVVQGQGLFTVVSDHK